MSLKQRITSNFTEEIGGKFSYLKFIHSPLYCKSTGYLVKFHQKMARRDFSIFITFSDEYTCTYVI